MSDTTEEFIRADIYNSLPLISGILDEPAADRQDLDALCALIERHGLKDSIGVRLIHRHFDLINDEVMIFKNIEAPILLESIQVMIPASSSENPTLHGMHYFVDENQNLQSYEYTPNETRTTLSQHPAFVREFTQMIVEKELQQKWGLSVKLTKVSVAYQEFEVPARRSTVMIPQTIPIPEGHARRVVTDWVASGLMANIGGSCQQQPTGLHPGVRVHSGDLVLGVDELGKLTVNGVEVEPGSLLYIIIVWWLWRHHMLV